MLSAFSRNKNITYISHSTQNRDQVDLQTHHAVTHCYPTRANWTLPASNVEHCIAVIVAAFKRDSSVPV
jgi:hypothetical protein